MLKSIEFLDQIIRFISIFSSMEITKFVRVLIFNGIDTFQISQTKISNEHRRSMVKENRRFLSFLQILFIVILAPYGINGTLIGSTHRDIDLNLLRENWEKNYPIRRLEGLPDFVEVTASSC